MRRRVISTALAVLGLGLLAPSALASFHLDKVTEVMPGTADAGAEYVEVGMPAAGENFFSGHKLTVYGSDAAETGSCAFTATLPNGQSQVSALIATPAAVAAFGVAADCTLAPGDHLSPAAGAACWDIVDCVAWGPITNASTLPSPVGTPAPAITAGSSLTRSIAAGCSTALEVSDDTDNSATDFSLAPPSPMNNASPPAGTACGQGPGGGGGGPGDNKPPNTKIKKAPKDKITKSKVKITFKSTEPGSKFKCKLDKGKFKSCHSPFKAKVDPGKHKFQVISIDPAGNPDPTAAKVKFKRI